MHFYRISFDPKNGPFAELARALKERIEDRWETKVLFGEPADLKISHTEGERFGEIRKTDGGYEIRGTEPHDLWNMAGKVLRSIPTGGEFRPTPEEGKYPTVCTMCGMYFATHFNNYYCTVPMEELRSYIEDMALWGMEYLTMWFDLHHYTGMDDPNAQKMIERLLAIQEHVRRLGLKLGMGTMANEGFSTTPEHLKGTNAVQNGYIRKLDGYYHTEVCPSTEEGMALILKNRTEMMEVFKKYKPDFIIMTGTDLFIPQIQRLGTLGIKLQIHQHIVAHMPEHTGVHRCKQQQYQHDHQKDLLFAHVSSPSKGCDFFPYLIYYAIFPGRSQGKISSRFDTRSRLWYSGTIVSGRRTLL